VFLDVVECQVAFVHPTPPICPQYQSSPCFYPPASSERAIFLVLNH
jgi:hypothetical protein